MASQVSRRRAALPDDLRMSSVVGVLTTSEIDERIVSIIELAGERLMRLSDPSFEFVTERMRGGILIIHQRLKAELASLVELRTVYGDLMVCRVVARDYSRGHDQVSPYQHLRLAWLQLKQLGNMFDHSMSELDRLHNETLELLSIDVETAAVGDAPRTRLSEREAPADRWFAIMPRHGVPRFERMRVPGELSIADADVAEYCDNARRELLAQLDATVDIVSSGIAGFLSNHGGELLDLIGRYNDLIDNLQHQHRRM
ncbi:hypothetical protein [Bradyrhizobium sp. Arg816]|uniref:hypothetical protein n=1 Tax=Bradyrhizobium sp. Arg816 TaxID=2998491 RepID=UPI00249EAC3E|nr:hypothetical protein [Bradyrhizobium sp. Arg816]MDI3561867.1 hypothetical protein [Bradyrhizobium sp. Arg816]